MNNKTTEGRIRNGITFFRTYIEPDKFDHVAFQKYFPSFLSLVETYLNDGKGNAVDRNDAPTHDTFEEAKKIFHEGEVNY